MPPSLTGGLIHSQGCLAQALTPMKLPTIEDNSWCLHSGEAAHATLPDSFTIPPLTERQALQVGDAARLLFEILTLDAQGHSRANQEIMWVIVAECHPEYYIGILDEQPGCLEPSSDNYVIFGAEIPFGAEHIIEIAHPPQDYSDWQLSQNPERIWPR